MLDATSTLVTNIRSNTEILHSYKYWRIRIFYSMFLGYTFFYFTRKSYTFVTPLLIETFGYSKAELGILSTALCLSYAVSKFVSGILSEHSNPKYLMSAGLFITGLLNIFFGLSSSIFAFTIICMLNGWFQGWGWPPCAKLLTYWYRRSERGFWWSLCSLSHNVGNMLIPLLVSSFIVQYDWRCGMYVPGILAILIAIFLLNRLCNIPESIGLPPVESIDNLDDIKPVVYKNNALSLKRLLTEVLTNKRILLLAVAYFFVYIVRAGIGDWGNLFLKEIKHYSLIQANASIFWFELGGIIGMLLAGFCSDSYFKGKRTPLIIMYTFGLLIAIPLLFLCNPHYIMFNYFIMTLIGCLIYGPQMLIGLAATECVAKHAACTANGFVGLMAYVGSAATGLPLGIIIDRFGWSGYFGCLIGATAIILLVMMQIDLKQEQALTD